MTIPFIEENDQTLARKEHLARLHQLVGNVYPNKFERSNITGSEDTISHILSFEPVAQVVREIKEHISTLNEGEKPAPELKESLNAKLRELGNVRIAGRLAVPPRVMGKAAFVHLSDGVSRLQIYVRKQDAVAINNDTGANIETENAAWELFNLLDHGDFIGAEGFLFLTNTGELSVHVEKLQFLAKAMMPMPDKIHGISDPELQRRYRYADLIADSLKIEHENSLTTREVFERRAKLISGMRNYLDEHGYIEVETPMLTPKATGAAAKPFATHHNALDIPLYARIAPELYLKRLLVGGFEKVYELNRNFRNEGLSQKHNPEFTMLEFYCAYMDVNGMMNFCEKMLKESVQKATGGLQVQINEKFGELNLKKTVDFSRFNRFSMKQAINNSFPKKLLSDKADEDFDLSWLDNDFYLSALAEFAPLYYAEKNWVMVRHSQKPIMVIDIKDLEDAISQGYEFDPNQRRNVRSELARSNWSGIIQGRKKSEVSLSTQEKGNALIRIFEGVVETDLIDPTFITDFPKAVSPLSKASPENPQIAERFELFINGMECANGFSELNDPQEQYERFLDQAKEREGGNDEAMVLDEDYIRALSYGMPPAAGIGIGIDRLVMLLTNRHSIRDVILFPHMRPEKKKEM